MTYIPPTIVASGTTFAQFQAGGLSGHLERLITKQVATPAPVTALTWSATGGGTTGGALAAGVYLAVYSETNGIGETTIAPESAAITVAATNIPQVIFPALQTGNVARNLYLTPAGGATMTEVLYATGLTSVTVQLSAVAPSNSFAVGKPTENQTGLTFTNPTNGSVTNRTLSFLRSGERGNFQDLYAFLREILHSFNQGDPSKFTSLLTKFRHAHTTIAGLNQLCNEIGTLLDANPGTIHASGQNTIGLPKTLRTWP